MTALPQIVAASAVLQRLRPPCARNTVVTHPFARETFTNPGYTVRFPSLTEPLVAMGDGRVMRIGSGRPFWPSNYQLVRGQASYWIAIDHGYGIESLVAGLAKAEVRVGDQVARGQRLGLPLTAEVYYQLQQAGGPKNPAEVNRHFKVYDERYVRGYLPASVRFAPDVDPFRSLSGLVPVRGAYLVNVDFAGDGLKSGFSTTGIGAQDFWNLYTHNNFTATLDHTCGTGVVYSSSPLLWLKDWSGASVPARLEKRIEAPAPFLGVSSSWDPMLATWLGGYNGLEPVETAFVVKGLPSGPLRVLLYAGEGNGTFTVSLNDQPLASKSNQIGDGTTKFVEEVNYVEFTVTVDGGILGVNALGFLSGMQIARGL